LSFTPRQEEAAAAKIALERTSEQQVGDGALGPSINRSRSSRMSERGRKKVQESRTQEPVSFTTACFVEISFVCCLRVSSFLSVVLSLCLFLNLAQIILE
jgi:hypothetical protein